MEGILALHRAEDAPHRLLARLATEATVDDHPLGEAKVPVESVRLDTHLARVLVHLHDLARVDEDEVRECPGELALALLEGLHARALDGRARLAGLVVARELVARGLGDDELERERADPDRVAVAEPPRGFLDLLCVHERAVRASHVGDRVAFPVERDPGVLPRDSVIEERDLAGGSPAHDHFVPAEDHEAPGEYGRDEDSLHSRRLRGLALRRLRHSRNQKYQPRRSRAIPPRVWRALGRRSVFVDQPEQKMGFRNRLTACRCVTGETL